MAQRVNSIDRLPVETLCAIFSFVSHFSSARYVYRIYRVSHVCKKWRAVSTGFAVLWADMVCTFASPNMTDLILSRTRNAPLTFERPITSEPILTPHQLSLTTKHILRARILAHRGVHDWSDLLCGKSLPVLQALDVSRKFEDIPTEILESDGILINKSALVAPSLHRLVFQHMFFPNHAPSLRTLKLGCDLRASRELSLPASRLLSLLSSTPLLEVLDLAYVVISDDVNGSKSASAGCEVALPHLKRLIYWDYSFNDAFWRHIHAPPEVSVGIHLWNSIIPGTLSSILSTMERHLRSPRYTSIQLKAKDSRIGSGADLIICLRGDVVVYDSFGPANVPPFFLICFPSDIPGHVDTRYEILEELALYLHVANIRCLILDALPPHSSITTPILRSALVPYTSIETIKVAIYNIEVAHILDENEVQNGDTGAILPALRQFLVDDHGNIDSSYVHYVSEKMKTVQEILDNRAARHGIETELSTFDSYACRDEVYDDTDETVYFYWSDSEAEE